MRTYRNFIGGEWRESAATKTTPNINPANIAEVFGLVPHSTRDEADEAAGAAHAAFPGWQDTPAPKRGEMLLQAATVMKARKEELARMLTCEEGKAIRESRAEVQKAIQVTEFMAGAARRLGGATAPSEFSQNFAYTVRRPLGVVALITPWNFPVSIPAWKLAPALVAGNTVVFKPASWTPDTAEMLTQCYADAGLPPGVLNLIYGSGSEVGERLVEHPDVTAVSFTGSNAIGVRLYEQCARRSIRAQCEMGGKNPCVILEDADLDLAVEALVGGAFGATGQRCTAMSRAIVVGAIADKFLDRLLARTAQLRVGAGLDEATFLGPCVSESQMNSVLEYVEIGRREGGKLLCGGVRLTDGDHARGYYVAPTIFDSVTRNMRIAREEIFGPVLSIIRVPDFESALEAANNVDFGLTSVIYTNDLARAFKFVDKIEAGMAHVNSPWLGGEVHLPFGGTKATGIGPREMGDEVLNFYTEIKTVYINYNTPKRGE